MYNNNTVTSQAILLMAYGSPETANDIAAYYTDIRRGNPPDDQLLLELNNRYAAIGGKTPLLAITKKQAMLLEKRLGITVYIGMKHWHPYISETVEQIAKSKAKQITALVLAPHYSRMSIGDYANRLKKAVEESAPLLKVTLIERWGDNPVFVDSLCRRINASLKKFPKPDWNEIQVLFTAHSLPVKILESGDPYQKELLATARLVAEQLHLPQWRQVFQSAGRTRDSWLGPDILTELRSLAAKGTRQVLVAPIGFTTDNLEILYDLDVQAAEVARTLGITFERIPSANVTKRFIDALQTVVAPYISRQ